MNNSITVQPLKGRAQGRDVQQTRDKVTRLVELGGDPIAAQQLVERLTAGITPEDKFEAAAMDSFMDSIAALSSPNGRLTSVS